MAHETIYKKYKLVGDKTYGMVGIQTTTRGPVPAELQGAYTSETKARQAIDAHLNGLSTKQRVAKVDPFAHAKEEAERAEFLEWKKAKLQAQVDAMRQEDNDTLDKQENAQKEEAALAADTPTEEIAKADAELKGRPVVEKPKKVKTNGKKKSSTSGK